MVDEVLKPLFRLLERKDVMPNDDAIADLETVLDFIEGQGNMADARLALREIHDAVLAAKLAQPGAYI